MARLFYLQFKTVDKVVLSGRKMKPILNLRNFITVSSLLELYHVY